MMNLWDVIPWLKIAFFVIIPLIVISLLLARVFDWISEFLKKWKESRKKKDVRDMWGQLVKMIIFIATLLPLLILLLYITTDNPGFDPAQVILIDIQPWVWIAIVMYYLFMIIMEFGGMNIKRIVKRVVRR